MKKIIFDTNIIMAIGEFGIDVFSLVDSCCDFRYQVYVLSGTIDELQKIELEQKGKFKRAAKLGLSILQQKKIAIISSSGDVDDSLVEHSKSGDLVVTQDVGLKKRLVKPYLTIRQKKRVVLIE